MQPPRLSDAYKNRAHSHVAAQNRGFSGPLTALIPIETRAYNRKEKERVREDGGGFDSDVDEPKSPKVSCMGQIKQRKKLQKLKREKSKKIQKLETKLDEAKKNQNSGFGNIFRRKSKSFAAVMTAEKTVAHPPPGLSQMKRFSSGRDAFANFDWTKQQVAPVERECYSDDDEQRRDNWDDEEEDEFCGGGGRNDVMIPFSAPMMIGGGGIQLEPRKEICLWKKRNMPPPKPLKLNTFR